LSDASLTQLQAALGTSYTIERELGRGGMATVYLARDSKHHRPVALKVLHSDLAASLGPERFRREITIAAQLQHPHILGVFDSGETPDGQLWFTMPFVEGETLRSRLRRDRQLPIDDALRITREVAGALDYAHQHGVIHRDIKPENVLLTLQGDALLADFGIARALSEGATDPGASRASLTQTGLAVGTPQYMSPEQASGERNLDARSDVYALGAVCYELLAGEPPFTGPSQQAVIAKMMSTDAPSVRVLRPGVPVAVDEAVLRSLARIPGDRWKSAAEFGAALAAAERSTQSALVTAPASRSSARRPSRIAAVSLGTGFLIGVGLLFAFGSRNKGSPPTGAIRLAVLPFENAGDSADGYFADGMTDAVHDKLANVSGLEVIGSASSRQYRGTGKSPQEIGKELGVRYLVEGRIQWAKGAAGSSRVRVNPELIDVETSADKWAQGFDAPLTDVFQVQGDIASKVAQSLKVALTPATQQDLASSPTKDLVAYDSYLRGVALRNGGNSPAMLRRSIGAFRDAVQRDSTFALAWSGLATTYALMYTNGIPTPALADSADRASARALALQPDLPAARAARSVYYSFVVGDNARALEEARTGLAHAQTTALLTASLTAEEGGGQWDAAAADAARATDLDPRNGNVLARRSEVALARRDSASARVWAERALAISPANLLYLEQLVMADLQSGDLSSARRVAQRPGAVPDPAAYVTYLSTYYDLGWVLDSAQERLLLSLGIDAFDGDSASMGIVRAEQYHLHGDETNARAAANIAVRQFEKQLELSPSDVQRHLLRGLSFAYLGRNAEAVKEGERALAIQPSYRTNHSVGPYYDQVLARIYMMTGQPDRAIDLLESILQQPYYLTRPWLRIDPTFAPLRGNPRFEKLVAS
jgi:eukaryotic-like serine/threonine-protein kinase